MSGPKPGFQHVRLKFLDLDSNTSSIISVWLLNGSLLVRKGFNLIIYVILSSIVMIFLGLSFQKIIFKV